MANTNVMHVNRTYRSTVFIMLFEEKENLLELYNAMSGKHYTDPELLEINTLENAIYMSIKNDVSFLMDGRLSLYEHQSTYSPNLPLRFLFYISNLYSGITKDENLYGTRKAQIPIPEFIIFYNGEEERPERETLKLSDLYTFQEKDKEQGEEDGKTEKADFKLELKAELLNICGDNNRALKEACRTLREYAVFTDKMRKYTKTMDIQTAAERTIEECIKEDILREFLTKHRAEVRTMSIFEYDQEKHMRQEREQAWEEGLAEGEARGKAAGMEDKLVEQIRKKLEKGRSVTQIAEDLEEEEAVIKKIMEKL
ncbi:MAG TPA: hypothetical protein H9780_03140 [Candidatus Mediterraneibacter merdavium]|nr:hypothetical protein [Candidatus Mediterraneibacter merdavium]